MTTCIACGHDPGYNRAIVHVDSGLEVGELCERCEHERFEDALDRADSDDACALCSGDGAFALPTWDTDEPDADDEDDCTIGTYDVYDDTVRLCDTHFDAVNAFGPERNSKHKLVQTRLP